MSILYTTRSVCENKYPIEIKKNVCVLPERIKWMKLWNQRKVHVWRKLPNRPVISYRSGWRRGGVGWGKEGFWGRDCIYILFVIRILRSLMGYQVNFIATRAKSSKPSSPQSINNDQSLNCHNCVNNFRHRGNRCCIFRITWNKRLENLHYL